MVQSLGISVGNQNSYVAAGQSGGIEIILNDYSQRATPTMVGFTDKIRCMGVDASQNLVSNLKNTIYDLMLLLGKPYNELPINDSSSNSNYQFKFEEAKNGQPLVVVKYLGVEKKFTITQVLAMLFTKLRSFANDSGDCVISCPQFYNDIQKAALYEAALIAGLNPLQIISDMSAVIMNYVYYRTTNKENSSKLIAFVNFGQSNLQTCVAWIRPGKDLVKILASDSEQIGGKDFDHALANHFIKEHNLKLNPKAYTRLLAACEKVKKLLTSNSNDLPIHVESLISEDKDFTARIDRAKFEEICEPLLQRVEACLLRTQKAYQQSLFELTKPKPQEPKPEPVASDQEQAMSVDQEAGGDNSQNLSNSDSQQSGADQGERMDATDTPEPPSEEAKKSSASQKTPEKSQKDGEKEKKKSDKRANKSEEEEIPKDASLSIEIVGGSSRIPAVKQLIQKVFHVAPSTTLNTDEAVARGCVLHCATLHPGIKVARIVKIIGSESFFNKGNTSCDKEDRRVELELILNDKKYRATTEARNSLEEYIYNERSTLEEGDEFLVQLTESLDWLWSDDGEEAVEEDYTNRLNALKKFKQSKLPAAASKVAPETEKADADTPSGEADINKEASSDAKQPKDAETE